MAAHSLSILWDHIRRCCLNCGRDASEVVVIGASKRQPPNRIQGLIQEGLTDLGENYVQELIDKQAALESHRDIHWHFIGHLQRKKVRQIIGRVDWIHSVDRIELAQEINHRAAQEGTHSNILIQIHTGTEASKGGVPPEEAASLIRACNTFEHVHIGGLMTLPPYFDDTEQVRPFFSQVRELRDAINQQAVYKQPLRELSMGMSHDYQVAIEEGATMIRIGTLLFGPRE